MKSKKTALSVVAITMIIVVLIMPLLGLQPIEVAHSQILDLRHSATISPATLTLAPPISYQVEYEINVTSNGIDYLNKTCIKLPEGFTLAGYGVPQNWTLEASSSHWANFTWQNGECDFKSGKTYTFSVTVNIDSIPPTEYTFQVYAYQGKTPSRTNPVPLRVTVKLQFSASMTPYYIKNGTSYIYTIKVKNDACPTGIVYMEIWFPAGPWSFNELVDYSPRTWTVQFDGYDTFYLWGPNLLKDESVTLKVNMTTPPDASTGIYYWEVRALDSSWNWLGLYSLEAVIDSSKPTVQITKPDVNYYTVGSGNYIWVNVTISDTPSIAKYGINVTINDTARFELKSYEKVDDQTYNYYFVNKTAIADGKLALKITATDPAGNIGATTVWTIIDHKPPKLVKLDVIDSDSGNKLPFVGGVFWMGATTKKIQVNASFYDPSGFIGTIWLNATLGAFQNNTLWPSRPFDVTGSNYVILNITLTDGASPKANKFTQVWEIKRDTVKPTPPAFTPETICGGIVIKKITATDNVGILKYKIYINGTASEVSLSDLNSATLKKLPNVPFPGNVSISFSGALVLDLSAYAGKTINLTICTIDYGANPSNPTTYILTIPKGKWHPIELYQGWNLISLPLVPKSTKTSDIYSLILKQGAAAVQVSYGFDNQAKAWTMNPLEIRDGNGYWLYVTSYDVLIIQGTPHEEYWGIQPIYYLLYKGWNLAGYTETTEKGADWYISSLQEGTYYRYLFIWDAQNQRWKMIDTDGSQPGTLSPGQGFWMLLYEDQTLVPPVP